jgi:MFS family permease
MIHVQASIEPESDTPAPPRDSAYKWWVVFMLWFVCFFNYADRQAIYSVFPRLQAEFGFDKSQLGLIGSAFMWVYAFCAPLAGVVGDRVQRKHLILGGCLFWSLVTVTTSWCGRLWQFVTVRALEGFGETFYFPASLSLTSDYHSGKTRSRALSFHQSSVYVGTIAGSAFGALFAARYDWRWGFYIFGGLGMVLALILYRYLREPRRGQSEEIDKPANQERLPLGETVRLVFRRPTAVLLMLAFFGANLVAMVFLTWTTTFLIEKFHFDLARAGLVGILLINVASSLGVSVAGPTADRLASRFAGGRIIVQAVGLLVGAGFVVLVGRATDTATMLMAMAAFGVCKGFYDSGIFAPLYDVIEPRARATATGFMNTVGWAGGATGTLGFGLLAVHGRHPTEVENMSEAIALGGCVYLAAAAILLTTVAFFVRRDLIRYQETIR